MQVVAIVYDAEISVAKRIGAPSSCPPANPTVQELSFSIACNSGARRAAGDGR
jgi:hypothetical protein